MSLLDEYKELKKVRLEEAEKSKQHYLSVNLPGSRKMSGDVDTDAVRKRLEEMKVVKALPNHD